MGIHSQLQYMTEITNEHGATGFFLAWVPEGHYAAFSSGAKLAWILVDNEQVVWAIDN